MNSQIIDIAFSLPDHVFDNNECERLFPGLSARQIEKKIGITSRRIASESETATDLAVKAAEQLLARQGKHAIDFLIFCTQSPDFKLPASACLIQDRLGLELTMGALDINQGCSGYVYGLSLAKGLIASGSARRVLLLTGDTYSKYIHPDDRGNRTIFGDGATATLIAACENKGIGSFVFGTDGSGWDRLVISNGGCRHLSALPDDMNSWLYMNGPEIFNFTIKMVPPLYKSILNANHMELQDLKAVIFHQANAFMLNHLKEMCGIADDKFIVDMRETGNTVSSTIPIVLAKQIANGRLSKGDKVMLAGFGVGYSWAGVVVTL